jgi:hypothetical protein
MLSYVCGEHDNDVMISEYVHLVCLTCRGTAHPSLCFTDKPGGSSFDMCEPSCSFLTVPSLKSGTPRHPQLLQCAIITPTLTMADTQRDNSIFSAISIVPRAPRLFIVALANCAKGWALLASQCIDAVRFARQIFGPFLSLWLNICSNRTTL